jgi:hypothetical protein
MRAKTTLSAIILIGTLALSGCVTSDLERGAIGAGVGGLTAAALNGNIATGVLIGAAGGALCDDVGVAICR